MDKQLKLEVETQVIAMAGDNDDVDKKQLTVSVLLDYLRNGEAERFVRPDGKVGFRATKRLLDRIKEEALDMDWED
jgi:hypothetical protein